MAATIGVRDSLQQPQVQRPHVHRDDDAEDRRDDDGANHPEEQHQNDHEQDRRDHHPAKFWERQFGERRIGPPL